MGRRKRKRCDIFAKNRVRQGQPFVVTPYRPDDVYRIEPNDRGFEIPLAIGGFALLPRTEMHLIVAENGRRGLTPPFPAAMGMQTASSA